MIVKQSAVNMSLFVKHVGNKTRVYVMDDFGYLVRVK